MGYRSNVTIAISKYARMQAFVEGNLPKLMQGANSPPANCEEDAALYWEFVDIKWYESYPDIKEVITFLDSLEYNEALPRLQHGQAHYGFMRLGEEQEDIEAEGDPYLYGIMLNQEILIEPVSALYLESPRNSAEQ